MTRQTRTSGRGVPVFYPAPAGVRLARSARLAKQASEFYSLSVDLELRPGSPGRRQVHHARHREGFVQRRGAEALDRLRIRQVAETAPLPGPEAL